MAVRVAALLLGLSCVVTSAPHGQGRPEASVSFVTGNLAWGPMVLGMTVADAERVLGMRLTLQHQVNDTGVCEGLERG